MTETCALITFAAQSGAGSSSLGRPSTQFRSHGVNARSVENVSIVCL